MRIYAPTGARLAHADGLARPLLPGRASGPCVCPGRGCAIVKSPKPRPLIGDIAAQRLWGKGAAAQRAVDLLEGTFPQQRAFIEDPAKLKWALCTRRAAKSYSDGLALAKAALERQDVSCRRRLTEGRPALPALAQFVGSDLRKLARHVHFSLGQRPKARW